MSDLTTLNPATVTLLSKALASAAKKVRSDMEPGSYTVSEQVLLAVDGTVNVGKDYDQRFVQKAKPWNIVAVLLEALNTERAAAGKAGLDMATLVSMALTIDPKLAKKASDDAQTEMDAAKAPTMKTAKGKVTTKGSATALGGKASAA